MRQLAVNWTRLAALLSWKGYVWHRGPDAGRERCKSRQGRAGHNVPYGTVGSDVCGLVVPVLGVCVVLLHLAYDTMPGFVQQQPAFLVLNVPLCLASICLVVRLV